MKKFYQKTVEIIVTAAFVGAVLATMATIGLVLTLARLADLLNLTQIRFYR